MNGARISVILAVAAMTAGCSQSPGAAAGGAQASAAAATPSAAVPTVQKAAAPAAQVVVNRVPLPPQAVSALAGQYGQILPGRYWYDSVSGLWGMEGGPYMGRLQPGLQLGGPLPADISATGTGTFINGREIHPLEYQALQKAYGTVYPGRFWLRPDGWLGPEGGGPLVNLAAGGPGGSGGNRGGGAWSSYSPLSGSVGGDGSGCTYFSGVAGGESWSNC